MGLLQKKHKDQQLITSTPEPPVGTAFIVFLRTFTVIYMLCSAILMSVSIIYKPWRIEWLGNPVTTLEFSIWQVCRRSPKGLRCYEGELDEAPEWFLAVRSFFMLSVVIQFLAALFLIIKLLITKNSGSRQFLIPAFVSLTSAICTLTPLLMLIGYREFEFLEDSRMYRMGWKMDEIDIEDGWGWPYYLMWFNFAFSFLGFFVCLYTHYKDSRWARWYATEGLRRQARHMAR